MLVLLTLNSDSISRNDKIILRRSLEKKKELLKLFLLNLNQQLYRKIRKYSWETGRVNEVYLLNKIGIREENRAWETRISRFAVMAFSAIRRRADCVALIPGKHVVFQVVSAKPLETSWSTDPPGTTYDLLQRNGVHREVVFRAAVAQPVPVQRGMSTTSGENYRAPFYLLLEH